MANKKGVVVVIKWENSRSEVEVYSTANKAFESLGFKTNTYKVKWKDDRIYFDGGLIIRREIKR